MILLKNERLPRKQRQHGLARPSLKRWYLCFYDFKGFKTASTNLIATFFAIDPASYTLKVYLKLPSRFIISMGN